MTLTELEAYVKLCDKGTDHDDTDFPWLFVGDVDNSCDKGWLHE